jgi:hypothetical protein
MQVLSLAGLLHAGDFRHCRRGADEDVEEGRRGPEIATRFTVSRLWGKNMEEHGKWNMKNIIKSVKLAHVFEASGTLIWGPMGS